MEILKQLRSARVPPGVPGPAEFVCSLIQLNRLDILTSERLVAELKQAIALIAAYDGDASRYEGALKDLDETAADLVKRGRQLALLEEGFTLADTPGADAARRLAELEPQFREAFAK